ncbi:hypothetical protein AWB78_08722 [Caballeronia calidae]|uniref:Uncharacterized protein n=2 Tax=Caballeronia calidae TaxID=1777139 RepID=A0A158ELM9_9BURK|nr:hypothetical protein AWB78_08722 [Caballeronia calidae]
MKFLLEHQNDISPDSFENAVAMFVHKDVLNALKDGLNIEELNGRKGRAIDRRLTELA